MRSASSHSSGRRSRRRDRELVTPRDAVGRSCGARRCGSWAARSIRRRRCRTRSTAVRRSDIRRSGASSTGDRIRRQRRRRSTVVEGTPLSRIAAMVLGIEAVVIALAIPVAVTMSEVDTSIASRSAWRCRRPACSWRRFYAAGGSRITSARCCSSRRSCWALSFPRCSSWGRYSRRCGSSRFFLGSKVDAADVARRDSGDA